MVDVYLIFRLDYFFIVTISSSLICKGRRWLWKLRCQLTFAVSWETWSQSIESVEGRPVTGIALHLRCKKWTQDDPSSSLMPHDSHYNYNHSCICNYACCTCLPSRETRGFFLVRSSWTFYQRSSTSWGISFWVKASFIGPVASISFSTRCLKPWDFWSGRETFFFLLSYSSDGERVGNTTSSLIIIHVYNHSNPFISAFTQEHHSKLMR